MTVINPNSISGITSITLPAGADNVLTIHTNDGTERFRIDSSGNVKVGTAATISPDGDVFFTGVTTATTYAGSGANLTNLPAANVTGTLPAISGANLTNLPAANLTGALPAISGANLTGIAATDNVRTGILDVAGIATFRSDVNIPNINGGQIGGRRNLLINGAMKINQRVQTGALGYFNPVTSSIYTLDRWRFAVGSSFDTDSAKIYQTTTAPSQHGFTKSLNVDIGNTATPSDSENALIQQSIEAQDLQHLSYGTSSAKTMTLSFWVYSNKTGTYCVQIQQDDASKYVLFEYTISASNTWEKKTITIAGNTANSINNDHGIGLKIDWHLCSGSSDHVSATSTWTSDSSFLTTSNQVNLWDNANNYWYLTGCQLEVGDTATEFEHRSHGEELALCQRYYYKIIGNDNDMAGLGFAVSSNENYFWIELPVPMRDYPTYSGSATAARFFSANNGQDFNLSSLSISSPTTHANPTKVMLYVTAAGTSGGYGGALHIQNQEGFLEFSSEL